VTVPSQEVIPKVVTKEKIIETKDTKTVVNP